MDGIDRGKECRKSGAPIRHPKSQELAIATSDQLKPAFQGAANAILESRAGTPPCLSGSFPTEDNRRDVAVGRTRPMTIERHQSVSHREAGDRPVAIVGMVDGVRDDLVQSCEAITGPL